MLPHWRHVKSNAQISRITCEYFECLVLKLLTSWNGFYPRFVNLRIVWCKSGIFSYSPLSKFPHFVPSNSKPRVYCLPIYAFRFWIVRKVLLLKNITFCTINNRKKCRLISARQKWPGMRFRYKFRKCNESVFQRKLKW